MYEDEDDDLGYLASYGVMIVPPPERDPGGWFVTITRWNDKAENYIPSQEGPIVETREEALEEAQRALAWLVQRGDETNLIEVWEQMQREKAAAESRTQEPPSLWQSW